MMWRLVVSSVQVGLRLLLLLLLLLVIGGLVALGLSRATGIMGMFYPRL